MPAQTQENRDVIIVGSGPAGISVALSLLRLHPALGQELVVLEKATHPRPKLCGGGLTPLAEEMLDALHLERAVRGVPVRRVRFNLGSRCVDFERDGLLRIVQRQIFDADLVRQARAAGIEIHENEEVLGFETGPAGIRIRTRRSEYRARVVVGADGANSLVRRKLLRSNSGHVSRLMEVVVAAPPDHPAQRESMAIFNFGGTDRRLQGYTWCFPTQADGQPYLSFGVFDSRIRGDARADLKQCMRAALSGADCAAEETRLQAHPERWFHPDGCYAGKHVLLAGDAAGIEPWLGEGISIALAYGPVVAAATVAAFESGDFSFENYTDRICKNRLGRLLNRNRRIARCFYARPARPLLYPALKVLQINLRRRGEPKHA